MQKPIDTIMQKEMSRKEFITTVGFGIASIMGLSTLLQLLGKQPKNHLTGQAKSGYGTSAYGQ